ncbi:protein kinase C iota type-like [Gordionus sp. m RMFG-2023]|uniref:protein kinase C iota type-like n=1 Tax=Gordionus sp. m RMFG-2023 TaxID=3053472 RepID=UPI0031FDCE8F
MGPSRLVQAIPSRKCEISDFNIFTLVKEGKFNREYLASCDGDKQPQIYRMKFIPKQVRYGSETIDSIRKFKTEKMVLEMATSYSFLMGLHASYSLPFGYILVTKDIGRRNLSDYIEGKSILNGRIAFYAAEIILAINFLHRNDIVHRGICPKNILLDNGHIKLSNFATCKNPRELLGCDPGNYPWDIMFHSYFKDINWEMLEQRKIKPPRKRKRK